jgi:hypothetical protein
VPLNNVTPFANLLFTKIKTFNHPDRISHQGRFLLSSPQYTQLDWITGPTEIDPVSETSLTKPKTMGIFQNTHVYNKSSLALRNF